MAVSEGEVPIMNLAYLLRPIAYRQNPSIHSAFSYLGTSSSIDDRCIALIRYHYENMFYKGLADETPCLKPKAYWSYR